MKKECATCRYVDFDTDALPCQDCDNCSNVSKTSYWAPKDEDISDPIERIRLCLECQTYILLEIGRLRNQLNELIENIKERNKE